MTFQKSNLNPSSRPVSRWRKAYRLLLALYAPDLIQLHHTVKQTALLQEIRATLPPPPPGEKKT